MANEDIKEQLTARGISFAANAGREKLQALLDAMIADEEQIARAAGATGVVNADGAASAPDAAPAVTSPGAGAGEIKQTPPAVTPKPPEAKQTKKSELVTVRVISQAIAEDHGRYAKGEQFETTAERAAALGELVEIID